MTFHTSLLLSHSFIAREKTVTVDEHMECERGRERLYVIFFVVTFVERVLQKQRVSEREGSRTRSRERGSVCCIGRERGW